MEGVFISCKMDAYAVEDCGSTLCVEDLMDMLSEYPNDTPVFLFTENGRIFGSVSSDDILSGEDLENDIE